MTDVFLHPIVGVAKVVPLQLEANAGMIAESVTGILQVRTDVYLSNELKHLNPDQDKKPLGVYALLVRTDHGMIHFKSGDITAAAHALITTLQKIVTNEWGVQVYAQGVPGGVFATK